MLKLNRITDYAVVVLTKMADITDSEADISADAGEVGVDGTVLTTPQLAQMTGLQPPTVAKLMKQLAHGGLVDSLRGAAGGYRLARAAEDITVADIVTAMEGPIALAACVDGAEASCTVESLCPMAGNWNRVNLAIRDALQQITLRDMAAPAFTIPPKGARATSSASAPILEIK